MPGNRDVVPDAAPESAPAGAPALRREAVLQDQERRFRRLLHRIWETSAFYREFYSDHGIREQHLPDLTVRDLPFLAKQLLMEHFDRAVTDPRIRKAPLERWFERVRDPGRLYQDDLIALHSSGTSGTFGIFVYGPTDWKFMNAVMAERMPRPERYPQKTRLAWVCIARGHHGAVSSAIQLRGTYDVLIVSAFDPEERVIQQLERFQPDRLAGNSSVVARLADAALEGRLRITPIRIITVGDLLTPSMEQKIRDAWGVPILNHYGATESLFLAIRDDRDEAMTVADDLNIFEVLDEQNRAVQSGGTGRVVITNLYNYTLPVLRYEMGDTVVQGDTLASGFGSIRRICPGIADDALPVTLGHRRVELPAGALRSFYAAGIEGFQFVARDGSVEVLYVAPRDLEREVRAEFERLLALRGVSGAPFTVRRVPFIAPDDRTAKVRLVVLDRPPEAAPRPDLLDTPVHAAAQLATSAFTEEETAGSVVARFAAQVERYGERPALLHRSGVVSYADLDRAANQVAHALIRLDPTPARPVALLVEPGLTAVTAILGVLKAGKFYVPLDPFAPPGRLESMLSDTDHPILLTDAGHLSVATAVCPDTRKLVNFQALAPHAPEDDPSVTIPASAPAYLFYTSGSTGQPKGVLHSHRSVLHQIAVHTDTLAIGADDRVSFLHSHCFSASRLDIFGALLNGACVVHLDLAAAGIGRVAEWLRQERVTILQWLPTGFRHMAGELDGSKSFPALRWIMLGSEPLLARDVALFRRHFAGSCRLLNRYATTETGTIACYKVDEATPLDRGTAPIGFPIDGVEVRLLGEAGTEVGTDEIGEIVISSPSLAEGYWRRPELTRRSFESDPLTGRTFYRTGDLGCRRPDGLLRHVGRLDSQRKILGYRIELEETEAILLSHPGIRGAAVAPDEETGDCLVAYLVAQDATRPSGAALRSHIRARLPGYMVPGKFIWVDALPVSPNGKLDRLALPALRGTSADRADTVAQPRNAAEEALLGIWCEVLRTDQIGVDDNFFDVGGDSLRAGQVLSRIISQFGIELDIRQLFESPSIAALAITLQSLGAALGS
ncbi:MAG TPA: amino acid adenylation domain-containing protein [Gemmatimonadales bacterium]